MDTQLLVKQVLVNLSFCGKSSEEISLNDSLQYDLGIDSLATIELLVALERTFNITISDEEILDMSQWMQTVGSVADFIDRKQYSG